MSDNNIEKKQMSKKLAYIYFAICVVLEQVGNYYISFSEGYTVPFPTFMSCLALALCFFFFGKSLKVINLAIAYAVWTGVSIIFLAVLSVTLLGAHLNIHDFIGMGIILVAVIVMNLKGEGE